jgi:hypothetical protein
MSGKDALCRVPAKAGIFHLCPAKVIFAGSRRMPGFFMFALALAQRIFAGRRLNDILFHVFELYLPALN